MTDCVLGRPEKVNSQTSGMYVSGESDDPIVPSKLANKSGQPEAELVEGRGSAKGNTFQTAADRAQNREHASIGLEGVRRLARRSKGTRFTTLLHHVNRECLRESYAVLNRQAKPGIDEVTWKEYGQGLEARLEDLHDRVHRGTYRAKPSKRAWIPKADGRQRPLGIASLEDKVIQQAVRTVLEQVYEADFLGFSYGFRPGRSQHNALDALWVGLTTRKVNWVLDADIQGFLETPSYYTPVHEDGPKSSGWLSKALIRKPLRFPRDTCTAERSPRLTRCKTVWRETPRIRVASSMGT